MAIGVLDASAQDNGPVTLTIERDYEGLVVSDIETALRLEYRLDNDEFDRSNGASQRNTEQSLREIFELDFGGYAGHPNLFAFDLGGEIWLEQIDSDASQGGGSRSDRSLLNFDATGTFLAESYLPVTAYARRSTSDLNRQFGGSLTNTLSQYGARLDIRDRQFPTQFEVYRREQEQNDAFSDREFLIEQDTVRAEGRGAYAQDQRLSWDLTYDSISQSGDISLPQDFDRIRANLSHTIDFGDLKRNQLRSSAQFYEETGERDFRQLRFSERLRLQHSEKLSTRLEYVGQIIERSSMEQNRHELVGHLTHQLFESLATTAQTGYRWLNVPTDDFSSEEVFAVLQFDYKKQVPYGRFAAGLDLNLSHLDETSRGTTVGVVGQLFTFDISGIITLTQRNIDANSIDVRDAGGLITYIEGIDYFVVTLSTSTEVHRILGGGISAGQSVLIDFDIGPEPGGITDTFGLGLQFRYSLEKGPLKGLSFYTRLFDQDEERTRMFFEGMEFPENDFTSITYGADYTRDRWYGRIEYEDRDSNLDPFTVWRIEGRYTHRLGQRSNAIFNALYQSLDRTNTGITSETMALSANMNHQFNDRLRGTLQLLWHDEHTSIGGDAQGFEQEARVQWERGQTDIVLRFRNSLRYTETEDTMFQTLFVGLRREF